jgi:uncharacterized membrane protein YuzA (DUF378 family)
LAGFFFGSYYCFYLTRGEESVFNCTTIIKEVRECHYLFNKQEVRGKVMKNYFNVLDWICWILVIIGALNWGLIGFFSFNLIALIFGDMTVISRIIYAIIGLAAIYLIVLRIRMAKSTTTPPV